MGPTPQRSRSCSETGLPNATTTKSTSPCCSLQPTADHSRGRKRSRSLDHDQDDNRSDTTTLLPPPPPPPPNGPLHHPPMNHPHPHHHHDVNSPPPPPPLQRRPSPPLLQRTDHHDHHNDDYDMTWEPENHHTTVLLKVKRDDTRICIKGRGYLTNCGPFPISIHGYHIPPMALQSDAHNNNNQRNSTVYFDSARWSSWMTLSLHGGHILQIASSNSVVTTDPSSSRRTFEIHPVDHPSMTTTIRPTLIPASWCRAVQGIVQDYTINTTTTTTTTTRPNEHEDTTTVSSPTSKSPTVTYQHLSYFQDSVDDDDDDDERNAGHEEINNDNPCNATDHPSISEHGYQIMICGAKGVGKSTCLRYTINSLLNVVSSSSGVMVLDADVGQPEYTTTGMLQLTLVRHANLVPPHLSQLLARHKYTSPTTTTTTTLDTNNNNNHHHHETDQDPVVVVARHYFGSMTSSTDPMSYMQCIESLLRQYQDHIRLHCNGNDPTKVVIPLLINLDGWTKDLGYEILTTLVQDIFQLRHVIQISGNTPSKILDLSDTIQKLNLKRKSRPKHHIILHKCDAYNIRPTAAATTMTNQSAIGRTVGDTELDDVDDDEDDVDETVTKKVATSGEKDTTYIPSTSIIPASILRDIRLITYFMQLGTCDDDTNHINDTDHVSAMMQQASQIWDTIQVSAQGIDDTTYYMVGQTLAGARPYVISIDAIRIRFILPDTHNDITTDDHIMEAINGTLVGLCTVPENEHDALGTPTVLLPCWGLGLVRAIDRKRRLLFVITPIDADSLQNVNCLTIGSNLHLPVQCYFRGPHAEAFPYLQFARPDSVPILGSDPMKSRNNINRRGRASGGG